MSRSTRGPVNAGVELGDHPLRVEPELGGDLEHRLAREFRLELEERVVVLPELALRGGGLAGLGRQRRQGMALGDRQVAEDEDEAIAEAVVYAAQHRLGPEAERALEVAEHHQLQRPSQLATGVVDLFERRSEGRVH